MDTNLIVGAAHIGTGALLMAVARPLAQGKIGPNALYGVRFPQSFASESNWYAINRFGGQRLIFWSKWLVAAGLLTLFLPLERDGSLTTAIALLPVFLVLIAAWESYNFARKM